MKIKLVFLLVLICNGIIGCKAQQDKGPYSDAKVYTNLEKALKNKSEVKVLDLSDKGLTRLPQGVTRLENLEVLILNNNELTSLPTAIGNLRNLERLELMKNKLDKLPDTLTGLKRLKRLNVAYNNIYEKDIKFLKKILPECFIITQIDL